MKIAFDAKRYYHNHTGLGNYARTLITALQQQYPEHTYLLYDEKSLARTFSLRQRASREGCDLYHGLSNEMPLLPPKGRLKSIVTLHDTAWRTYPDMYTALDRQLYEWKYGWSVRHADCVLAISESTRRDAIRFYHIPEERVRVIYQPVGERFYTPMPADKARRLAEEFVKGLPQQYLLSVGSLNSRKNLLGSLQALARIAPAQRPPLVVIGRGSGAYVRECHAFAQQHLRQQDVIWLSQCNDNEMLQALYTDAMALLYPSHYEGFGLPVVEALLQGTPVLTSTVSSLPEAAGPGGLLAAPDSVDEMSHQLHRLIEDDALRHALAREGEAYCRRTFDPQALTTQVMNLYKEMV